MDIAKCNALKAELMASAPAVEVARDAIEAIIRTTFEALSTAEAYPHINNSDTEAKIAEFMSGFDNNPSATSTGAVTTLERFFDGNDDRGSICCNLDPHPGIARVRDVLTGLLTRPDVEGVYVYVLDINPGEHSWPHSDTVLVVGNIKLRALKNAVADLMPDEVGTAIDGILPPDIRKRHNGRVRTIWWD